MKTKNKKIILTKNFPNIEAISKLLMTKEAIASCELDKGETHTFEEEREILISKAKKFNGLIKTEDDILRHIDRLQRCSDCGKEYYDKRCPECIWKFASRQKEEIVKEFIKRLKEKFADNNNELLAFELIIDKLAGKKL